MRMLRICLLVAATATAAVAQTNAPLEIRRLSLQDCVEAALTNNLRLQIDHYNPQIAIFAVQGAYGGYDPTFSLSGQHSHNESGPQLFGGLLQAPAVQSDQNRFTGNLEGLSPIGTSYTLSGSANDSDTVQGLKVTP